MHIVFCGARKWGQTYIGIVVLYQALEAVALFRMHCTSSMFLAFGTSTPRPQQRKGIAGGPLFEHKGSEAEITLGGGQCEA